jgi:hypothetical protein
MWLHEKGHLVCFHPNCQLHKLANQLVNFDVGKERPHGQVWHVEINLFKIIGWSSLKKCKFWLFWLICQIENTKISCSEFLFISNILNIEQVKWNDKVVQKDPKGLSSKLKIEPIRCKQNIMNNWITLSKLNLSKCNIPTKVILQFWNIECF